MIKKLKSQFTRAISSTESPLDESTQDYHWFFDCSSNEWLGIPKQDISLPELTLLQTLFEYKDQNPTFTNNNSFLSEKWFQFLFQNGSVPSNHQKPVKIYQLFYSGEMVNQQEMETALQGFFEKKAIIVWVNPHKCLIIENDSEKIEFDIVSISQTLESEFFINSYFYIGKSRPLSNDYPVSFQSEARMFEHGRKLLPMDRVLTFEKTYPYMVSSELSEDLKAYLKKEIVPALSEDPEMLQTIKAYLDSNFNVTLTAKLLYLHRNTLQYRLDKFSEKTGINLKNFPSALTVYLACIVKD